MARTRAPKKKPSRAKPVDDPSLEPLTRAKTDDAQQPLSRAAAAEKDGIFPGVPLS